MFYSHQHWFLQENNVQYSHVFSHVLDKKNFYNKMYTKVINPQRYYKAEEQKRQLLPLAKLKLFSCFHYSNSFCWSIQILITFSSKMPIWWKQRQPFQYKLYIYFFSIFYKINGSKTIIFIYPKIIK